VAARFPDRQRASAALDALRRRLVLRADDAAIAPLGMPGFADVGDETLLAGRFANNRLELVRSTLTKAGGSVVADVDERCTRPRGAPDRRPQKSRRASDSQSKRSRQTQPIG